jgi:[acyl-carrier-protein] S-malonyltransferase
MSESGELVLLCPGQGAQKVGMGKAWADSCPAAAQTFAAADEALAELDAFRDAQLSTACFDGPAERLDRTDIAQPALFTGAVASWQGLLERDGSTAIRAAAGLSLGEYTALHLAGAFGFVDALRLVALRGRLMQQAAESSRGGMVALIGADESKAEELCDAARGDGVLVCANFNAPGQIVLSGDLPACERAVERAAEMGVRATPLQVAGAFHSPLMQPAADGLAEALAKIDVQPLKFPVWSNVTGRPHEASNPDALRGKLVEQLVKPVRWSECCADLVAAVRGGDGNLAPSFHELAPGSVLRGLMRRIDRTCEVTSHDGPPDA